jgi:hypothetical protein
VLPRSIRHFQENFLEQLQRRLPHVIKQKIDHLTSQYFMRSIGQQLSLDR